MFDTSFDQGDQIRENLPPSVTRLWSPLYCLMYIVHDLQRPDENLDWRQTASVIRIASCPNRLRAGCLPFVARPEFDLRMKPLATKSSRFFGHITNDKKWREFAVRNVSPERLECARKQTSG